jgi:hypothetical protein
MLTDTELGESTKPVGSQLYMNRVALRVVLRLETASLTLTWKLKVPMVEVKPIIPLAEISVYCKVRKPGASISKNEIALTASRGYQVIVGKSKSTGPLGNSVSK